MGLSGHGHQVVEPLAGGRTAVAGRWVAARGSWRSHQRIDVRTEERICWLRRSTKREPVYFVGAHRGVLASMVWFFVDTG